METTDSSFISREAKRRKAIIFLGGKCNNCIEENPIFLDFHHKKMNEKANEMGHIWSKNWNFILTELVKCELLCCKCHRLKHYDMDRFKRLEKNILQKIPQIEFNSRNRLTIKEKDKIIELYKNGTRNYKKISKILKIKDSLVKQCLFKCNIYKKGKNKEISEFFKKNEDKIIELYKNNNTLDNILSILNCEYSRTSLENNINELIITNKLQRRDKIIPGKIISDNDIITLHNQGNSAKDISKMYNVAVNSVRRRLNKLNNRKIIVLKKSSRNSY